MTFDVDGSRRHYVYICVAMVNVFVGVGLV